MHLSDSDIRRFWAKVALPDANGCMLWQACINPQGYGKLGLGGATAVAHRVSLQIAEGPPVDESLDAAHSCRNRHCVAPDHLRWASRKDNLLDRVQDGTLNNGERNGQAVLTPERVLEIRYRYSRGGITQKQLGQEFGVCRQTIGLIVNGKKWAHLGGVA